MWTIRWPGMAWNVHVPVAVPCSLLKPHDGDFLSLWGAVAAPRPRSTPGGQRRWRETAAALADVRRRARRQEPPVAPVPLVGVAGGAGRVAMNAAAAHVPSHLAAHARANHPEPHADRNRRYRPGRCRCRRCCWDHLLGAAAAPAAIGQANRVAGHALPKPLARRGRATAASWFRAAGGGGMDPLHLLPQHFGAAGGSNVPRCRSRPCRSRTRRSQPPTRPEKQVAPAAPARQPVPLPALPLSSPR